MPYGPRMIFSFYNGWKKVKMGKLDEIQICVHKCKFYWNTAMIICLHFVGLLLCL